MEYEGVDNYENSAHYFENLLINTHNDCTPGSKPFYLESEQFYTPFGQLESPESIRVVNTLADNAFKEQITPSD